MNFHAYCFTTERDGRFAFARVPPGRHRLVLRVEISGSPAGHDGKVWRHQALADVTVLPGESTTVVVDGSADILKRGEALDQATP